jgi:hypothetical protein
MALDALLVLQYSAASVLVWDVPLLRPNQTAALCHVGNPLKPCELLLVKHTGGGKTHIFKVAGVAKKGITFIL